MTPDEIDRLLAERREGWAATKGFVRAMYEYAGSPGSLAHLMAVTEAAADAAQKADDAFASILARHRLSEAGWCHCCCEPFPCPDRRDALRGLDIEDEK